MIVVVAVVLALAPFALVHLTFFSFVAVFVGCGGRVRVAGSEFESSGEGVGEGEGGC